MESGKLGCAVKREKGDDCNNIVDGREEDHKEGIVPKDHDHKLQLAKAEIEEVREENQRLKKYLTQIMEDYKSLEKKLHDIGVDQHQERDQLVSLSLGRTTSSTTTADHRKKVSDQLIKHPKNSRYRSSSDHDDQEVVDELGTDHKEEEGLTLGLEYCKFEVSSTATTTRGAESPTNVSSADNSVEEVIKEDVVAAAGETWPPRKALKNARSINGGGDHNENPAKKARVSVRVRCETPTMNDGCQWRKYGQKIAKGNPCPRAYYRCTVSPSCPVRKQVQRCAQDMSILITTYEGTHNHPLPISATAMASTTSAAACMLMSGSTVSGSNPNSSASSTTPITTPAELHGLNFYFSDGSKPNQYYPPNSSLISPSPSCPTITLDLTSNTVSNSSSSPLIINRSMPTSNFLPRYTSTNLNFSSWNNGGLNHGQNFVKNQFDQSLNFGRRPQENLYQAYMQKNMASNSTTPAQQSLLPDTIEAATKAITSDPNFQSALQAALSSIISSGAGGGRSGSADHGQNSKLGDVFPVLSSFPSGNLNNANKCVSSYLNKSTATTSTNSQPGSLMFLPPNSSPFSSTSKSKSASPDNSRDQVK